jgi:hypothetical protein
MNAPADFAPAPFRCPTCRAAQEPADVCRRCKCDLRLLGEVDAAWRRQRQACLTALAAGAAAAAARHAAQCLRLRREAASWRLIAVCELAAGRFDRALAAARQALGDEQPQSA